MIIYMKAHDYLYAGVSLFVCWRMIFYLQTQQTTAQKASRPDTGSNGRDTDKPPSKQPRELTGIRQGQQNTMLTTGEASGDTMRRHTQKKEKSREECHTYMFRKHEDIPKKSTNSTITYRL